MAVNRIKILETIRQGQIGGGESQILDLVNGLNKSEFEPVVLSFTDGPMVDQLKKSGIKTYVVETLNPFNASTYNTVKEILRKEEIDILHAHGTRALSNTIFPARNLGIPSIYTVHNWSFHQDQAFHVRKARELTEKFLTDQANITINVSKSIQKNGLNHFNIKRSRVINYGIDLNRYNPDKKTTDLRQELGIQQGKTIIGCVLRTTVKKDPFTLIRAVSEIAKTTRDIQLLLIGGDALKQVGLKLANDLNVSDMITFHKFTTEIPEILSILDIYTLPSFWDGLPIGILEAMAMQKAIIANSTDGSKEAISDGKNGMLIPYKDHQGLANAILRLHQNPQLRKVFGESARKTAEANYDLRTMVRNNEMLYRELTPLMMQAA